MTQFPAIQRSCPYLDRLDSVIEGDFCRMCRRTVHDLSAMDERELAHFLSACGGDACASYTMSVKPALAAALIAASAAVLVVPETVLAASHHAARHPRPGQSPPVQIRLAGAIAPNVAAPPPSDRGQRTRPAERPRPPQKPD
jgi:hypothetical protein